MQNLNEMLTEENYVNQTHQINQTLASLIQTKHFNAQPTSWEDVQKIVRAGRASRVFSIGDQLTCQRGNDTLVWDVIGIDHDTPSDPHFTHSLTLQLHDCFPTTLQFDAPEAFYYAENGLAAGTYHFTVDSTDYQFTLESAIAADRQLILNFTDNTPTSIFISATVGGDFVKDTNGTDNLTIAVTAGSGGTPLNADYINDINRARYGSSSYKESAIRQWLGSSAAAGSFVWVPQSNFDRPPSWKDTAAGFLNGMDADFLAVLGRTHIVTARNTVGGYDETDDFFFLPSGKEVYFADNPAEGAAYPYFSDFSDFSSPSGSADTNRVKNKGNAGAVWWVRTPIQNTIQNIAYQVFRVMDNGRRSSDAAFKNYYTAPVCNII